jgi:protein-tyrosine phosphatase
MPPSTPIPYSYWVEPTRFLAGIYPGADEPAKARKKVRQILEAGITYFVDLTTAHQLKPYASLLQEEATLLGLSAKHQRLPIQDFGVPTPDVMIHILDTIDAALRADQGVYLHCWAGIGRTGTVVGCYLVRHGMSGEAALDTIAQLREAIPGSGLRSSPETEEQRQMIVNWSVGI